MRFINLTPERTAVLLDSAVDWIGISVPAIREKTYLQITGRKDFPKIRADISHFISRALKVRDENFVMVSITRDKDYLSLQEKEEAIVFWQKLGVKRIEYYNAPISRAGNVPKLRIKPRKSIQGCRSVWTDQMLHVLFNGDIIPCCMDWSREIVLGNVCQQSIEEIWTGERYTRFRNIVSGDIPCPNNFICKKCEDSV
ncbi:SPASM domain-containing protein [candidate division CSSED10-310 bacterium]|uniref:SPASM domain-containing protein n=1 Tax=candidate division CSSED10-310 bacterium TaxID=2855610 RepID=A0ABV6Z1S6_UNCC1